MCFTDTPNAGDERAVCSSTLLSSNSFHSSFVGGAGLLNVHAVGSGDFDLSEVLVDGESSVSEVLGINTGERGVSLLGFLLDTKSVLLFSLVVGGMVLGLGHCV